MNIFALILKIICVAIIVFLVLAALFALFLAITWKKYVGEEPKDEETAGYICSYTMNACTHSDEPCSTCPIHLFYRDREEAEDDDPKSEK